MPFLVQAHESLAHRLRETLVQGEALALPVAGSAQAADLAGDDPAVLFLPLPGAPHELLAPQRRRGSMPSFASSFLHLELGRDPGVVGARHPQGRHALHALVADHQVFHRDEHGMAQVQLAGHVGRRNGDDEGFSGGVEAGFVRIVGRFEIAACSPTMRKCALRWQQKSYVFGSVFSGISLEAV